jgi:hypothetical protein
MNILTGEKTAEFYIKELQLEDYDIYNSTYQETLEYVQMLKRIKLAGQSYAEREAKRKASKEIIQKREMLDFLYKRCKPYISTYTTEGIGFESSDNIIVDGVVWALAGEVKQVAFADTPLISKVVTVLLDDEKNYEISGTLEEYVAEKDESMIPPLKALVSRSIADRHAMIHTEMPKMRERDPDKYYAILHRDYKYYYRDHYLRDQFLFLLSKVPVEVRKRTVIYGPYGPSMEYYHRMGYKMYLHFVSNTFIMDRKYDLVTDVTGFYVLMDPVSYTNKEMDGKDQLIDNKHMPIISVARGIGFLHYYRMNASTGGVDFLDGYDSYIYTPHKSIFYLLPRGMIPDMPGHQDILYEHYYRWVLGVNLLRNMAMTMDMSMPVPQQGHIYPVVVALKEVGVYTSEMCRVFFSIYMKLKSYFEFDILSYKSGYSGMLNRDDRRYLEETDVETLFYNERSVHTLKSLTHYEILYKRGYLFVKKKSRQENDEKMKEHDKSYERQRVHRFYNSTTNYQDKYLERGPESQIDKGQKNRKENNSYSSKVGRKVKVEKEPFYKKKSSRELHRKWKKGQV